MELNLCLGAGERQQGDGEYEYFTSYELERNEPRRKRSCFDVKQVVRHLLFLYLSDVLAIFGLVNLRHPWTNQNLAINRQISQIYL